MSKHGEFYRYSRNFKLEVLAEIRKGNLTIKEASQYYGVSLGAIYKWIKKFGETTLKKEFIYMSLKNKDDIIKKYEALKRENQKLKEAVSDLSLDKLCLEKMIEVAERDHNMKIKKKSVINASKKLES